MFVRVSIYIIAIVLICSGCVFSKQQLENKKDLNNMQSLVNSQQKTSRSTTRRIDNLNKKNQELTKKIEALEQENQELLKRIEAFEKELMQISFAIYEAIKKNEHK